MNNKVKYGLKNVHWHPATIAEDGTATYTGSYPWPGAVDLALDPEGELSKFFADDSTYASFSTNAGYAGDYECALIPDEFRRVILGEILDSNGVQVETSDAPVKPFALSFEFAGDVKRTRHVLYNCTAERPSIAGHTKEESTEAQTETLSLSCGAVYNAALERNIVKSKAYEGDSQYANWYSSVYQPVGSSFVAWPSALSIAKGDIAIAIFSGGAGTVTASSDNSDVTAEVFDGKVVIEVDSSATAGATVTLTRGSETAEITVTV